MKARSVQLAILALLFSQVSLADPIEDIIKDFELKYLMTAKQLDDRIRTGEKLSSTTTIEAIQHEAYLALITAEDITEEAQSLDERGKRIALHSASRFRQLSRHLYHGAPLLPATNPTFATRLHDLALSYFRDDVPVAVPSSKVKRSKGHKH